MKFLYRYVFRGLGLVLVLAMITILWTAWNYSRARERRTRDEARRMLEAQHKDADAEIRKYTDSQMQFGRTGRKENAK